MTQAEQYIYKLCPKYSHTRKIILRQIHILDKEYDTIINHQNLSKSNKERLLEIHKQTETLDETGHPCKETKSNASTRSPPTKQTTKTTKTDNGV